jgi:hypothetical protein
VNLPSDRERAKLVGVTLLGLAALVTMFEPIGPFLAVATVVAMISASTSKH